MDPRALSWDGRDSILLGPVQLARYAPSGLCWDTTLGRAWIFHNPCGWLENTPEVWHQGLELGWTGLSSSGTHVASQGTALNDTGENYYFKGNTRDRGTQKMTP